MILIVLVVGFFWLLSDSGFCKLGLFRMVENFLYFIVTLVSSGIYLDKLLLILMLNCVPRFSYWC